LSSTTSSPPLSLLSPLSPPPHGMLSLRWATAGDDSQQSAEGDRRRQLEREVDESGGRRSQQQSRTEENGYAADEVLGISAAQYSIFDLIMFTP
jgi:hypothetical protein